MITKFSETVFDKTKRSNLKDNNLIRSIASNIINKNKCEYEIGIECFYCWHDVMNDLRIWTLVKGKQEGAVSAVFSSSIIECLYPGVLKMINKINEFKNFNFLFSKNHNEVSYDNSKYLFSNQVNSKSNFLLLENIGIEEQKAKKTDALVKLNIIKNKYSQQYFYISENCSHA
jgi:hypothetical protein